MVIVLDMHGIVFCHDSHFDIHRSSQRFIYELNKYAESHPMYQDVMEEDFNGNHRNVLKIEYDSIKKGIGDNDYLQIYALQEFREKYNKIFAKGNKVIIISASLIETSKMVLETIMRRMGERYPLEHIDFYNSEDYGKKNDPVMWKRILSRYKTIDYLFEDKEMNLEAAKIALKMLHPKALAFRSLMSL